jgi:hypothetical protein
MKFLRPVVIALFAIMIAINGYQVYRIAFVRHEADFVACLAAAHDVRNGINPYLPTAVAPYNTLQNFRPYIYPLFLAWLWVPFTFLTAVVASYLWYAISVLLMFYALWLCAELAGLRRRDEKWLATGIAGVLFASIFQWVLMFGHEDFLVLVLLLLGARSLIQRRSIGGSFFGAAISAKLMPIVVLPMLIRKWRAAAFGAVTIVLLCIAIPYLIAGNKIFGYYSYWVHDTLATEMTHGDSAVHSFALACVVAQLGGLAEPTIVIKLLCGLFLLAFPLVTLYRDKQLHAFFLTFMLIPLTSTRSEPNHLTMILPATMLIVATLLKRRISWKGVERQLTSREIGFGWGALVVVQLMILWGYGAQVPFDTIGMLVVFGAVFWLGVNDRSPVTAY